MPLKWWGRTRKRVKQGTTFVFQVEGEGVFRVGLVVRARKTFRNIFTGHLLYLYEPTFEHESEVPPLEIDQLLIPPKVIDTGSLTTGLFDLRPCGRLHESEVMPKHYFRAMLENPTTFEWEWTHVDEDDQRVDQPVLPLVDSTYSNAWALEWQLADALGIDTWPEEERGRLGAMMRRHVKD